MLWQKRNDSSHNKWMHLTSTESARTDTIEWARWSTGNCARKLNLTIWIDGIYTTQNHSKKMSHSNSTDHIIFARWPDRLIVIKKSTCGIVDHAVPTDHLVKLKESEKKDKYPDPARELKKQWIINVTVMSIVICSFGRVTKRLIQGLDYLEIQVE